MSQPAGTLPLSRMSIRLFRHPIATAFLLGLFCFLVYNANLRQIGSGDTMSARFMPLILWHSGTLALDADARLVAHGHSMTAPRNRPAGADAKVAYFEPWAYWMIRTREHKIASLYPVVTPLLAAPLYLPAVIWLNRTGWQPPQVNRVAEVMEKLSASLLASLASVLMYLVLRRDGTRWTLPLALVFAFGTNTWMISSQALWQHGTGELLIALALLLALARATPARTALLGAVCLLMAANRPPDALIAGALGLFVLWTQRRGAVWFFAGAAVPLAALLYYNVMFIGTVIGGYAVGKNPNEPFFHLDWTGLAGLLISPARGLLVFSPFLVLVPVGLLQRLRAPGTKHLAIVLGLAALAQFLVYSQADWRAGVSWGPRWLTDLLPILVWMLAPAPLVLRPFARVLLVLAMVASVAVQAIGAFWYTKASDDLLYAGNADSMAGAWDLGNIPFLTELQHAPARAELLYDAHGSLDRVGPALVRTLDDVPRLEPGAMLEGWALTGGRTPSQLLVLIDGIVVGSTADFLPRADVNDALHTTAPSGWRIAASLWGVAPGERTLQLAVRADARSDARIIREQRVVVVAQELEQDAAALPATPAADLDAMAVRAAVLLREHQSKEGYWLTSYTAGVRYIDPGQEMNTYTTSVLVDLLAPLARQHGLDDALARARGHLAAQIESNGLVRYHGLPDAPTIGTLGCAITPDSDDTALVWRIAGPGAGDPRQRAMLAELARYRDARGLYHTWLAPENQYQCIDAGSDPNPSDIAIQMHIYLMLRELDPPAAQSLCSALQRSFWDEDIWAYYARTALVPYLRSVELGQRGCPLPLPSERLALPATKRQAIWSEAARLLVASPQDTHVRDAIRSLLAGIGSDDFAALRKGPPLLYHNDLSGNVRRYYWSEDAGYALWLRLYDAARANAGQLRQPSL